MHGYSIYVVMTGTIKQCFIVWAFREVMSWIVLSMVLNNDQGVLYTERIIILFPTTLYNLLLEWLYISLICLIYHGLITPKTWVTATAYSYI